jgi:hypothetical protein
MLVSKMPTAPHNPCTCVQEALVLRRVFIASFKGQHASSHVQAWWVVRLLLFSRNFFSQRISSTVTSIPTSRGKSRLMLRCLKGSVCWLSHQWLLMLHSAQLWKRVISTSQAYCFLMLSLNNVFRLAPAVFQSVIVEYLSVSMLVRHYTSFNYCSYLS